MRSMPRPVAVRRLLLLGVAALLVTGGASHAATLEIEGPAGAAITIDGRVVGILPLASPPALAPGSHVVSCSLRGYESLTAGIDVVDPGEVQRLHARLTPLSRRDALFYSLAFAGLGQRYVGHRTLGYALSALEVGGLLAGLTGELVLRNRRDDYIVLKDAYRHAVDPQDVLATRAAAAAAWKNVEDAASLRRTGFIVAGGAVVISALDAWLRFPGIEAGTGELPEHAAAGAASSLAAAPAPAATVHIAWTARF